MKIVFKLYVIIVHTRESTCFIILYYYALYLQGYNRWFRKRFVRPLLKVTPRRSRTRRNSCLNRPNSCRKTFFYCHKNEIVCKEFLFDIGIYRFFFFLIASIKTDLRNRFAHNHIKDSTQITAHTSKHG